MAILGLGAGAFDFLSSIKVNPDVLKAKASSTEGKIGELKAIFDALELSVNKTKNYWNGEAAESHREYYERQKADIETLFKRLAEDVSDLNQMASVYVATEQEVKEISSELPADVIV